MQCGTLKSRGNADKRGPHEQFAISTVQSDAIIASLVKNNSAAKEEGLPVIIGEVTAFLLTNIGPKGTNFAKHSADHRELLENDFPILLNYSHLIPLSWHRHITKLLALLAPLGTKKTNGSLPLCARDDVDSHLQNEVFSTLVDEIKDNERRMKNK